MDLCKFPSPPVMARGSGRAVDGSLWVLLGSLSAFIDSVTINMVLYQRRVSYCINQNRAQFDIICSLKDIDSSLKKKES